MGVLLAVAALGQAACAGPLRAIPGGWRHSRHAFTIASPGAPGEGWRRIRVEDAVLSFARAEGETMSMHARCGHPVASPEIMARRLVLAVRPREVVRSESVSLGGLAGWSQVFETRDDEERVRVRTVTLVDGDCTFDWILATRLSLEPAEAAFEAWWRSFRRDGASPAGAG